MVNCFKHLGSKITIDGGIKTEVKSRINDVGMVLGGIKKVPYLTAYMTHFHFSRAYAGKKVLMYLSI